MMSATFFRSRFDQLFFMLKILRSGIPETKVIDRQRKFKKKRIVVLFLGYF